MIQFESLSSIRQISRKNPNFSEGALRWWVFNCKRFGFEKCVVRIGRRVYIDEREFSIWIEQQQNKPQL